MYVKLTVCNVKINTRAVFVGKAIFLIKIMNIVSYYATMIIFLIYILINVKNVTRSVKNVTKQMAKNAFSVKMATFKPLFCALRVVTENILILIINVG